MKNAPILGATVLLSSLTVPEMTTDVESVMAYDPAHDAWKVRLTARSLEAWVRERQVFGQKPRQWMLYDIRTPLAISPPGAP